MTASRRLLLFTFVPVVLLLAIQLVPYGRDRGTPPDGPPAPWDAAATRDLAKRACFDCHSNETRWPWYAAIAPASWRIQSHVAEGRATLNFSAFDAGNEDVTDAAGEAAEVVDRGEMPPRDYLLMHAEARLTAAEKRALADGLRATFAAFAEKQTDGEGRRGTAGGSGDGERREESEHAEGRGGEDDDRSR